MYKEWYCHLKSCDYLTIENSLAFSRLAISLRNCTAILSLVITVLLSVFEFRRIVSLTTVVSFFSFHSDSLAVQVSI